ncbi:hypothetical protein SAMN05216190_10572 [Pseudomonas borbori]|uniref:Uncharacterized protein n=1 Tax=Pseudomonas borbori TaxID=289003 RepID=A0A1I5MR33_9PSED|nr:hypothetical protein SAMN05216190_10572 [Pseudomonas borbori]
MAAMDFAGMELGVPPAPTGYGGVLVGGALAANILTGLRPFAAMGLGVPAAPTGAQ